MSNINAFIKNLEQHQAVIALSVIVTTLGAKYLAKDFETHCDFNIEESKFIKSLTVFSLVFINTKNIRLSIFFVVIYQIIYHLLVERGWCKNNNE